MIRVLALCLLASPLLAAEPFFDGGRAVPLRELLLTQPAPPPVFALLDAAAVAPRGNVVFVTLDGVRWQEFLSGKPDFALSRDRGATFPGFWSTLAAQGVVYPDMSISNDAELSMPAYHSIFTGATQPCKDNECGQVTVETFPERLLREGFAPADVAMFASWSGIAYAVEHVAGTTTVDAGDGGRTRLDDVTFPKAFAYLKTNKPRFLYISLNDADELAHQGDYPGYLRALRRYDQWLVELAATLDSMGDYGANTTLIVTTDHGRGVLWDWRNHGARPWARRVWMYARHPRMTRKGLTVLGGSHLDLRPTIESALGLAPLLGSGRGEPLRRALAP